MKIKTTLKLDFLANEVATFAWYMKQLDMPFVVHRDVDSIASAIRRNVKPLAYAVSNYTSQTKQAFGITSHTLRNICKTPRQLNYLANETLHKMKLRDLADKKAAAKGVPVQMEFNFND